MFYLSKLLLGGGILASSGGLSAYFIPQLTTSGGNTIFQEEEDSARDSRYQKLESFAQSKLEELGKTLQNLQTSKSFANKNKEEKHKQSLELMVQLATTEEALQKLYSHMEEKLKSLQKESQSLATTMQERLNLDAQFQEIKVSQSTLNQLVSGLKRWETQLNNVICTFKQQEEESKHTDCKPSSTTLISAVLSSNDSSRGGANIDTERAGFHRRRKS